MKNYLNVLNLIKILDKILTTYKKFKKAKDKIKGKTLIKGVDKNA